MKNFIPPKIIRQIFVLLLIVLFATLIFKEIIPYFSGVLGAITIYVLLRKWMVYLVNKKWKPDLAAAFLMVLSFVCILLPVSVIVLMLGDKIGKAVENSEQFAKVIKSQVSYFESKFGYDLSSEINVSEISSYIAHNLENFAGGTFNMTIAIGLMYFMLYYMFTNRSELRNSLYEYIPISKTNLKIIGNEAQAMVRSNAIGIPLVAISQGIIALIGFLIFGIKDPFFWFIVVTIGSMIPFVGTLVGILPVFILTMSAGKEFAAWGILIYGFLVVGFTDNVIRLFILKKLDNVHPLITLIGVIVGVPLFGFIGLIFGPLLISLFLIVVRIYKKEFGAQLEDHKVL
ncbi:AI-2E family transporter [Polaribacter litorisediminis]|uniref:AI-2E family transporter n=1 Tax=Polaribacter litorisediminis TaxID=1908341 RepID=UPI001CBE99C9|nr:AI-2E family transporter [Polaribacter litorisediminis]UAM99855.1 AI-2E family transporter [Polaribacter litorisediminis]